MKRAAAIAVTLALFITAPAGANDDGYNGAAVTQPDIRVVDSVEGGVISFTEFFGGSLGLWCAPPTGDVYICQEAEPLPVVVGPPLIPILVDAPVPKFTG